ncbi:hypothetical protein VMT65_05705 [Nocardia sp. CDC153]|uniref:hypothetical protein n=1 Tax=Nocardia sp. CDC153 TaxID=3112167 RepID=UPI002DC03635|nr:hypothetical protein [Nocardia sp. CDC153]MEC3952520.1 hypothetical protein [Nocardia sp. CDC153]
MPSISPWVAKNLLVFVRDLVNLGTLPVSLAAQNRLAVLAGMAEVEYADSPDPALSSAVEVGRTAKDLFVYAVGQEEISEAAQELRRAVDFHMSLNP